MKRTGVADDQGCYSLLCSYVRKDFCRVHVLQFYICAIHCGLVRIRLYGQSAVIVFYL